MESNMIITISTLVMILVTIFYFIAKKINKKKFKCEEISNSNHNYSLITSNSQLNVLIEKIKCERVEIIGLDVEYHRGDKYLGEISLFQITLPDKTTFIIDVMLMENDETTSILLKQIFESKKIEKVMHTCDNDVEWIYDQFNISTANVFDTLYAHQTIENNNTCPGLDDLLRKYNLCSIDKHYKKNLQKSNWKRRPLTLEQLKYAAQDSYYLIDLRTQLIDKMGTRWNSFIDKMNSKLTMKFSKSYSERLENKANNYFLSNNVKLNPFVYLISKAVFQELYKWNDNLSKERDINPENLLKLKLIYKIAISLPEDSFTLNAILTQHNVKPIDELKQVLAIIDNIKSEHLKNNISDEEITKIESESKSGGIRKKAKRDLNLIIKQFACKGPAYENHIMLGPNGKILSFCDSKKMNWYIQRDLAKQISLEPPTFQLNFEPSGRENNEEEEGRNQLYKENRCIVCEKEENYLRFHVVPSLYKQYFPHNLRSRSSHDIVLLCFYCMEKANKNYDIMKKDLSKSYNVPLIVHEKPLTEMKSIMKVKAAAKSILVAKGLPENRKKELIAEIIDFLNNKENSEKYREFFDFISIERFDENSINILNLKKIKDYDITDLKNSKDRKNLHGKLVIEKITDFKEFINLWRDFFIDIMKPKCPPTYLKDNMFFNNFKSVGKIKNRLKT